MVVDLLRSENANSRRTTGLSGMLMRCAKSLVGGVLVNAKQTGHQVGGTVGQARGTMDGHVHM